MKSSRIFPIILVLLISLVIPLLVGCNMPGREFGTKGIDVTQAYQTVQARLTQAVAQIPIETASQTTTPQSAEVAMQTPENTATTGSEGPTETLSSETRCNQAAAAYPKIDITIDDDTEMAPGEEFVKIWRVVNVGYCTWTADYAIVFFSGELMDAPTSLPLSTSVPPNQSVDLSVDMIAPDEAGKYQGNWKLKNAGGELFGIGPSGESPFWLRIQVVSAATPSPTISPTTTPTIAVQVNGQITLVISDTLDLDNLLLNTNGSDLAYRTMETEPPQHQLIPFESVIMGVMGDVQPGLSDCQDAELANNTVTLDDLAVGTFLCYRTDLGLPGWASIDGFDPEAGTVTLGIFTWKLP
jgi:hypothetical protein